MFKLIRDTLFTVAVIGLTAVGLKWNNAVQASRDLAVSNQTVLAAEHTGPSTPDFPLAVSVNAPSLPLGQTETVTITTVPHAALDVITRYPDGSVNHPQTFPTSADGGGHYSFSVAVSNFRYIGTFKVSVVANSGSQTTNASTNFSITSWQTTGSGQTVYPLVP